MADKKRIINKEKEIDADIDVVKRMSTKLGCYCIIYRTRSTLPAGQLR